MIRDSGGEPEEFTKLDTAASETSHRLPHYLPDGSAVLFTVLRYTYDGIVFDWKRAQVWVKSSKTGERKRLLENAVDARYAAGYMTFARQGKLFAVRFDPKTEKFQTWTIPSGGGVVRNVSVTRDGNIAIACSGVNKVGLVEIR